MGINLKDIIMGICYSAVNDENGKNIDGTYLKKTGDAKDNTVTFETSDTDVELVDKYGGERYEYVTTDNNWRPMEPMHLGDTLKKKFEKISEAFHNIRCLRNIIGEKYIGNIADGTVTGAISSLNTGLKNKIGITIIRMSGETDDCNNLPIGSSAYAYPNTRNVPSPRSWFILTYGLDKNYKAQIGIDVTGSRFAFRSSLLDQETGKVEWGLWKIISE